MTSNTTDHDYDYLIIGSGFGGSASALRLAEKGWRVAVAEQGRRIGPDDIKAAKKSMFKLLWMPGLRLRGYFVQHMFKHVNVVGGVGVGGGSIVWGAVMLPPKDEFYDDPQVKRLGVDLRSELAPHLKTAHRMLGVSVNPHLTKQDEYLRQAARAMNAEDSFGPVPNAVFFGEPDKTVDDPYFDGEGPARVGCNFCGGCLTGCPTGAKNALYQNYLYLAEKKGVQVMPDRKADKIEPLPDGGYRVSFVDPVNGKPIDTITAGKVIIAAGVVGTLDLLFQNRDRYRTLPGISDSLGGVVRTNSEALTAVLHPKGENMIDGTAISSDFYADKHTHITQNRFDRGYRFMKSYMGPLVDGHKPGRRALRTIGKMITRPGIMFRNLFAKNWEERITIFTVMQNHDNAVKLRYRKRWFSPFKPTLGSAELPGAALPSYLPPANEVAREFAKASGGTPMNFLTESLAGTTTTAHILSGCPMGNSAVDSVIDANHEVHGAPGLFIVDGSSIPANIGVNPSLTITAMAERFAERQPAAEQRDVAA
ncbi:FAD-dependent oxidoreductase [Paracoccus sp. SCSIO 75233]|uniref:FAD-dependent oxidoreductase n=1 Tax=Paracoccus sp. SCSIO 75233 TaxID=3017782 RepID=UPI0022F0CA0A|nr:FAD-dependent oxidoreductase [Paracoccus sp. SCSIO 75233]WBU53344.1 FAD-dependent oxidoreductase [Paracoccus sp. SCSIO 75233]